MIQLRELSNEPIIVATTRPDVNSRGTLALRWGMINPYQVFGRGIRGTGESVIFSGSLTPDNRLTIEDIVLSREQFPFATRTVAAASYEDPTVYDTDTETVLCASQTYRKAHGTRLLCNIVQYQFNSGVLRTLLTPENAWEAGLHRHYATHKNPIDLVKEFEILSDERIICEVGDGKQSYIVSGAAYPSSFVLQPEIRDIAPFLSPKPGTWYEEHTSTVSEPLFLDHYKMYFLPINGRSRNTWSVGYALLDEGHNLVEVSKHPFIQPPAGLTPGPHGQRIAFGSDALYLSETGEIAILYHAMDRYPYLWTGSLS